METCLRASVESRTEAVSPSGVLSDDSSSEREREQEAGVLSREPGKSAVPETELRALVVEPDTEGDEMSMDLEFGLGDGLKPRVLKRAKADSVLDERELAVDESEVRAKGVADSWPLLLRLSFLARCSPTSSRLGSVQTMSHMLAARGSKARAVTLLSVPQKRLLLVGLDSCSAGGQGEGRERRGERCPSGTLTVALYPRCRGKHKAAQRGGRLKRTPPVAAWHNMYASRCIMMAASRSRCRCGLVEMVVAASLCRHVLVQVAPSRYVGASLVVPRLGAHYPNSVLRAYLPILGVFTIPSLAVSFLVPSLRSSFSSPLLSASPLVSPLSSFVFTSSSRLCLIVTSSWPDPHLVLPDFPPQSSARRLGKRPFMSARRKSRPVRHPLYPTTRAFSHSTGVVRVCIS